MKRWIVIMSMLIGAPAHAGSETWVGGWTGKVTSKGCTDDGKKTVTLEVAITSEGGLRASGDVLEDGLGDLDWTEAGKALSGNRTGLTASLSAKGKLEVVTDGGCKITGTLKRATSGIAACDRLLALATLESQCKSDTTKLDDAHAHWKAWKKLKGKKKTAQAAKCTSDADAIATEVATCGTVSASTGVASCDDYVAQLQALQACKAFPDASKQAMQQGLDAIKQSVDAWKQSGSPAEAGEGLRQACQSGADALRQSLQAMGCGP